MAIVVLYYENSTPQTFQSCDTLRIHDLRTATHVSLLGDDWAYHLKYTYRSTRTNFRYDWCIDDNFAVPLLGFIIEHDISARIFITYMCARVSMARMERFPGAPYTVTRDANDRFTPHANIAQNDVLVTPYMLTAHQKLLLFRLADAGIVQVVVE